MVPELGVTDFAVSRAFYVDLIGFSVRFERGDPAFAYLELGEVQLMIEEISSESWVTAALEAPLGRGINLQIEIEEVVPLVCQLEANGFAPFCTLAETWAPIDLESRGARMEEHRWRHLDVGAP